MTFFSSNRIKLLSVLGALAVLIFIYFHHFHNGFQNDDPYFIGDNTAIRSLKNIPAIFTDSHTQSSLTKFQDQYRPMFILSLALDYSIGNGISPVVMHIHTFIGFLILILLSFLLSLKVFKHLSPAPFYPALLATCIFAYHPVAADVVNYLTARSNIFGTLYGMLFMVTWLYIPFFKKYHLYLIPLVIGCLFKVTTVVFVPLLWLYIIFFEYDAGFTKGFFTAIKSTFKVMLPALITTVVIYAFIIFESIPSPEVVRILSADMPLSVSTNVFTQAHVVLKYFLLFLMPENSNPYGRHSFITSPLDYHFITGLLFIITSFIVIYLLSLQKNTRAISFGLAWFFICLAPTSSFIPFRVNYVEYYMFPGLIGLSFALASGIMLVLNRLKNESGYVAPVIICGCLFFLSTLTYGSYKRVKVWGSDKAMLEDVLLKDPTDPYTILNLGVYYMNENKLDSARKYFTEAQIYLPTYDLPYLNLGILSTVLNDTVAANTNFQKAVDMKDQHHVQACYYYAAFLHSRHRDKEAIALLSTAVREDSSYTIASDLLKNINTSNSGSYSDTTETSILRKLNPSENDYITLSLLYFNKGEYEKSITACQKVIALDSNSATAYNNMCAAYNGLKQWDNAIKAGNKALQIQPDFTLAQNNVNFALAQKKK